MSEQSEWQRRCQEEHEKAFGYANTRTGERVEPSTPTPLPDGWNGASQPDEKALALLKEKLVLEVGDLLGTMEPSQVLAVHSFAICLKVGGVSPAFFTLIADALRVPGALPMTLPEEPHPNAISREAALAEAAGCHARGRRAWIEREKQFLRDVRNTAPDGPGGSQ